MRKGQKASEETRERMRIASIGRKPPSRLGLHCSPEHKEKIRLNNLKNGHRPPGRLGIPNSPEQKAKISATLRRLDRHPVGMAGDANPSKRPEVKEKISLALKGRKLSEAAP